MKSKRNVIYVDNIEEEDELQELLGRYSVFENLYGNVNVELVPHMHPPQFVCSFSKLHYPYVLITFYPYPAYQVSLSKEFNYDKILYKLFNVIYPISKESIKQMAQDIFLEYMESEET